MNKKNIISNTLMFIVILVLVVLFKSVFGAKNTLIGVAGITAMLSLLGNDYSLNPVKSTIYFVLLEVGLGLAAFVTNLNPWLALVVTFLAIFYVLYAFTYNTRKPTYVAFTLGYSFMVYNPVTIEDLPLRLAGLATCGLAIMVAQIIVNKDRIKKQSLAQLKISIQYILKQIELGKSKDDAKETRGLNDTVNKSLKNLIETMYEAVDKNNSKLSIELLQYLFIAQFLDSINLELSKNKNFTDVRGIKELSSFLQKLDRFINKQESSEGLLGIIDKFMEYSHTLQDKNYLEFKLSSYVSILRRDLLNTSSEDIYDLLNSYFIPNLISNLNSFKNNLNRDSLKFTFAFRGALIVSFGIFLVSLFDIPNGRWLVFSLISVVQPYLDNSKVKGSQRIYGTVIGLVLFEVLFSIITDSNARGLIVLLVGYISNYAVSYRDKTICTTVSALGVASIGASITILGIDRLLLVLIGTFIALFANKIILPYRASFATKTIIKKAISLNKNIFEVLFKEDLSKENTTHKFRGMVDINRLVISLIASNNDLLSSKEVDNFIYSQHIFLNDIRILEDLFKEFKCCRTDKVKLIYDAEYLVNKDLTKKEILEYINRKNDNLVKLILFSLIDIKENLVDSKNISKSAIKSI